MRDLEETIFADVKHTIVEGKSGSKLHVFRGLVSRADVRNGNDRVYPRSVLESAVAKLSEKLDGSTFGEADHPTDRPSVMRVAGIHRKVWMEANGTVWGESVIPETAMGRDLIAIVEAGGKIGISTRGRGSVRTETWEDGKPADIIEDDYEMGTWDFVVNQSEKSAMVTELIREHLESEDSGVEKSESSKDKESTMKTVEEFREKHPDLYEAVREECLNSLKEEFEAKVAEKIEAKADEIRTQMEEDVQASVKGQIAEAMAPSTAALLTIASILAEAGVELPTEPVVEGSEEAKEAFESLRAENAALKQAVEEIAADVTKERTERAEELIEAEITKLLKDEPHADVIREGLSGIKSVDEVAESIKAEKAKIAKLIETTKGEPKSNLDEGAAGSQGTDLDEAKTRQRRLAGIRS